MGYSQAQLRSGWSPACKYVNRTNVLLAYQLLDRCFKAYNYAPKSGQTWGANCRKVTGGDSYSMHSYFALGDFAFWTGVVVNLANAVDVNSLANPYSKTLKTDMPRAMIDTICGIRTSNGKQVWQWGGYFSGNKDAMHFELACLPADLATGINMATVRLPAPAPTPSPNRPTTPDKKAHRCMQKILIPTDDSGRVPRKPDGSPQYPEVVVNCNRFSYLTSQAEHDQLVHDMGYEVVLAKPFSVSLHTNQLAELHGRG